MIVFIFRVNKNTEEEYAKYIPFMEKVEAERADITLEEIRDVHYYYDTSKFVPNSKNEIFKYYINKIEKGNVALNKLTKPENLKNYYSSNNKNSQVYYHFQVTPEDNDNNTVNFIYFFLMKQRFVNCSLAVNAPNRSYYFKLSHFLWFEARNNQNAECIIVKENNDAGKKLAKVGYTRVKHYFPLFEINSVTYKQVLAAKVCDVVRSVFSRFEYPERLLDYYSYRYDRFHFSEKLDYKELSDKIAKNLENVIQAVKNKNRKAEVEQMSALKAELADLETLDEFLSAINRFLISAKKYSKEKDWLKEVYLLAFQQANPVKVDISKLEKTAPRIEIASTILNFLSEDIIPILPLIKPEKDDTSKEAFLLHTCLDFINPGYLEEAVGSDQVSVSDFYNEVKNMNMLGFLLFSQNFFYSRANSSRGLNLEIIKNMLEISNRHSDGLLQIIENTVDHSALKKGYFSMRIYPAANNAAEVNNQLLYTNLTRKYINYFEDEDRLIFLENSGVVSYLEILVFDYSQKGILDTFRQNILNKFPESTELQQKSNCLSVKDFFEASEQSEIFWSFYTQNTTYSHYGLKHFNQVVKRLKGYFKVDSMKNGKLDSYDSCVDSRSKRPMAYISGTQYTTLLPVFPLIHNEYISVPEVGDTGIEKSNMITEFKNRLNNPFIQIPYYLDNSIKQLTTQQRYNMIFTEAEHLMSEIMQYTHKPYFISFNFNQLDTKEKEMLRKIIFCFIQKINNLPGYNDNIYLVLFGFKGKEIKDFIADFITNNYFGYSEYYNNVWLYMYGDSRQDEFIIHGSTAEEIKKVNEVLSNTHGYMPSWINEIYWLLNNRNFKKEEHTFGTFKIDIIPFSVYTRVDEKNGETMFEQFTRKTLNTEIETEEFGARIPDTHVRIGSKIHITEFYEAELLFQNNYYVDRFAYIIAKDLKDNNHLKEERKILIVGYATYSEMLINRIQSILDDNYVYDRYIICEDTYSLTFRYLEDAVEYIENSGIVFIVPIGTTLTTHNKMLAGLERSLKEFHNRKIELGKNLIYNTAVVLVRDGNPSSDKTSDQEKKYKWTKVDIEKRIIFTELIKPNVKYFLSVDGKWQDPLYCEHCWNSDVIMEKPLLETNKSSVIPFTVMGIKEKYSSNEKNNEDSSENDLKVRKLRDVLRCGHILRNDNHFLYYFDTDKYFFKNKPDIEGWLKSLRENFRNYENDYNFIVTPMHHTNMGFVNAVNDNIFKGSAQIIRFEADKEFRENIGTKYSHLNVLCNKLAELNKDAKIRIHFVDDTIVTGATVSRARSIITSVFTGNKSSARAKVFSSIITLINRSSEDSKKDYIRRNNDYFSYVDLFISTIKNPSHFCFMCSAKNDRIHLKDISSTISMKDYWDKRIMKLEPIIIDTLNGTEDKTCITQAEKDKLLRFQDRMERTHLAGKKFKDLSSNRANAAVVKDLIQEDLIIPALSNDSDKNVDVIIDYIKIFSLPMLSYRKSARESIFSLMLGMIDVFLGGVNNVINENIASAIKEISDTHNEKAFALLLVLMKQLTVLNSNFIIRDVNIKRVWGYFDRIHINEWQNEGLKLYYDKFELKYAAMVKRLICLYNDEAKSTWLEYYLINHSEISSQSIAGINKEQKLSSIESFSKNSNAKYEAFRQLIFIENTPVLKSAVDDLQRLILDCKKCKGLQNSFKHDRRNCIKFESIIDSFGNLGPEDLKSIKESVLNEYYFDNFRRVLEWNGYPCLQEDSRWLTLVESLVLLSCFINYKNCHKHLRRNVKTGQNIPEIKNDYNCLARIVNRLVGAKVTLFSFKVEDWKDLGACIIGNSAEEPNAKKSGYDRSWLGKDSYTYEFGANFPDETFRIFTLDGRVNKYESRVHNQEKMSCCVLKYRISRQSEEIFAAFTMFFEHRISREEITRRIRFALLFSAGINNMLNADFKDDSAQKWLQEKEVTEIISRKSLIDHSPEDRYRNALNDLVTRNKDKNTYLAIKSGYLRQLADSFISRYYVQLLTDQFSIGLGFERPKKYIIGDILKKEIETLICQCCYIDYKICPQINREAGVDKSVLRSWIGENNRYFYIPKESLILIVVQLIRNAVKLQADEINIYKDGKYLIFHNRTSTKTDVAELKKRISERNLKGFGMTLFTAYGYIYEFYKDDLLIENAGKYDDMDGYGFYIGLPILSEGEDNHE